MSRQTWDGTANPSRETKFSGANGDKDMVSFPCSADHEQNWQPHPVDPYSCYICDHSYTHTPEEFPAFLSKYQYTVVV